MNDLTSEDRALLHLLRDIVDVVDPVPEHLVELGIAAFSVRRVDAELAELVSDSSLKADLVRSSGTGPRLLTFEAGDIVIDVQVSQSQPAWRLIGVVEGLVESAQSRVDIESGDGGVVEATLDDAGRFDVTMPPARVVRLRVVASGDVDVTTEWVTLTD